MNLQIPGYTLIRELGEGGMCVVYLARYEASKEDVAVKVLHEHLSRQDEMRQRFLQEASIMQKLKHEGIVNVRDFLDFDGRVAIVMDYIQGKTLDHIIGHEIGPIPSEKAIPVFRQILEAVDYAHSQGVVHRDLKPSNILVTDRGQVKVTDFGIAKVIGTSGMTRTGVQMGTLYYESPEQIRGARDVDHRSDIYALGMTLYEMLAGRLPFENAGDTSEYAIMESIMNRETHLDPRDHYSHIPSHLVHAVRKATAKDPDDRFQTCDEFIRDIEGGHTERILEQSCAGKAKLKTQQKQSAAKDVSQSQKNQEAPIGPSSEAEASQPAKGNEGKEFDRAISRETSDFDPFALAVFLFFLVILAIPKGCSSGRFQKEADIITDTETDLQWRVGPDEDITWDEAKEWVNGLGGNWHMPTRAELQGLWDARVRYNRWGPFQNSGSWVWSGEVRDSSSAWLFSFGFGFELWDSRSDSRNGRAFAVRLRG